MITRIGVINDIHGPYHDPRALTLALDVFEDIKIDALHLNGDVFDFFNINRHKVRDPNVQAVLEDEIFWGNEFFADIRKRFCLKGVDVTYHRGNHEEWLDLYLMKNCPAFWNMLQLEKMIDFDFIEVINYNDSVRVEKTKLMIQHSPPSYAATGPMTSLKLKVDMSYIWGCTHRVGHATVTGDSGEVYHGWFNGWLGHQSLTNDHRLVFKYKKGHKSWQQCLMVITVVDGTEFFVSQIPISPSYKVVVDGNLYEG